MKIIKFIIVQLLLPSYLWAISSVSDAVSKRFFSNQFNLYFLEHVMYNTIPSSDTRKNDSEAYIATCAKENSSSFMVTSMFEENV